MAARKSGMSKPDCVSTQCPQCGGTEHITVEHVIVGTTTRVNCHCRACDASWQANDLDSGDAERVAS
jgi:hypothetical protein